MNGRNPNLARYHTVGETLSGVTGQLKRAEVAAARLTAELLLGHVLRWDRVRILTHPEEGVTEDQWRILQALVRRAAAGEPLQYITQRQEFYGLPFRVTADVLIPRPETELLVEKALEIGARPVLRPNLEFIDVGTGSGCVAVAVAYQRADWRGYAVDISPAALDIARENAEESGVEDRIQFICGDLLESFPPEPLFDLILSNPPYVAERDASILPRNVRDHEPRRALFGGESGLETIARLVAGAKTRLRQPGFLLLEIGAGQSDAVARQVENAGFCTQELYADLQGIPRCLVAGSEG